MLLYSIAKLEDPNKLITKLFPKTGQAVTITPEKEFGPSSFTVGHRNLWKKTYQKLFIYLSNPLMVHDK